MWIMRVEASGVDRVAVNMSLTDSVVITQSEGSSLSVVISFTKFESHTLSRNSRSQENSDHNHRGQNIPNATDKL